jgi:DNA invertase Pin-like site-specific DNA recombinase
MRVGGYVRLSRDEDKESYSSILTQKSIIEEFAKQNQWTVGRYYEDDNCSGYSFDRPGFNALLRDLENNRIDVVIAKDLSRIGRHNAYTLLFIDNIIRLGKRLVLPKEGEGYDTGRDESDLLGIKTWIIRDIVFKYINLLVQGVNIGFIHDFSSLEAVIQSNPVNPGID